MFDRLCVFAGAVAAAAIGVAASPAAAEDFPTRPVTIIVASTPGGGTDIVSRIVGVHLRGALKNGASAAQIQEVLLLLALYCGIPAANEAHRIAADVLREQAAS